MSETLKERWGAGEPYERYVGRWSRVVAGKFLDWLSLSPRKTWVDVGCGTGALVDCILARCDPRTLLGIDRSAEFLAVAQSRIPDPRVRFQVGDAMDLPLDSDQYDVAVSGLVLNFVADHDAMVREMVRVTKPGGVVAAYVWDYAGGMEMMRQFWDAAIAVSPKDAKLDQGERFPICRPEALKSLWEYAGLGVITVQPLDITTVFQDFEDYWSPFLGKQGAAPTYLASLDTKRQRQIRELLQTRLVPSADGTIVLNARAWAVKGSVPTPRR